MTLLFAALHHAAVLTLLVCALVSIYQLLALTAYARRTCSMASPRPWC